VAASGWNAELIPDDELIKNEFPEVLAELTAAQNRCDELDALFDEVKEMEPEEWNADEYEVMPKEIIKEKKDDIKSLNAQSREATKQIKALEKRIKLAPNDNDLKTELQSLQAEQQRLAQEITAANDGIKRHTELEEELKQCRAKVREIERNKEALADKAREQISEKDAKRLITERWFAKLGSLLLTYLEVHTRKLQQAIEQIYDNYTLTLEQILKERDDNTAVLNQYLQELYSIKI
jgi:type I restriction enzyme M protein